MKTHLMKTKYILIVLLLQNLACSEVKEKKLEDGVYIEQFEQDNQDENKYNSDNIIYTVGTKLTFDYVFSKNNIDYMYEQNGDEWELVSKKHSKEHPNAVNKIILKVQNGNAMTRVNPNYNQSNIMYQYTPFESTDMTGLVENDKNIWFHPPRRSLFKILELNPFPFVKFPVEIGNTWQWTLNIGDQWGDKRWKTWEGSIQNKCTYKVEGLEKIATPFGKLACYTIVATGESKVGKTSLKAYFNKQLGFVRLDYSNIDGSTLNLNVINIEK